MKKYNIGQSVWIIKLNLPSDPKSYWYKDRGIKIEETSILGISDYKICLNNDWFTVLDVEKGRKDRNLYHYLDDISVRISIKGGFFTNDEGVYTTLYSTKKPTKSLLQKMYGAISTKIDKEYGFLFSRVKDEV